MNRRRRFDADVSAQIKLFNQDNAIGGGVKMNKKTDTKIDATVAGDTYFVVGQCRRDGAT